MRYGFLKFVIIAGAIVLSWFILSPTYQWYYKLSEEEKAMASVSKKELNSLTDVIEENIQDVRRAVGKKEWYKIAHAKNTKELIFNISPTAEKYILDLSQEEVKKLITKVNPQYQEIDLALDKYENAKKGIQKLEQVNYYKNLKKRVIKLGLDLAGGVHFVLGIDEEKLLENLNILYQDDLNPTLVKEVLKKENPQDNDTVLEKKVADKIAQTKKTIAEKLDLERNEGVDQALTKIQSRIDQFGVSEPVIRRGPQNTIVVELPGEKDKESAKEIVTRVGRLSLQLVNDEYLKQIPYDKKDRLENVIDREFINEARRTQAYGKDTEFCWVQEIDRFGMAKNIGVLPVYKKVEVDGRHITDARVNFDQTGEVYISFELDREGATAFAAVTKASKGKRLAIVLDEKIQSAPTIQSEILGGKAQITGNFSMEEGKTLAAILRSGSLPVPLKIEEERVVGPSLGADQISRGLDASLVSFLLIFVFCVFFYRWSGLNVNFAVILNIVFILAVMAQLGATMTLSGIAGLILTLGMSVDANIIINERIKEELREGRSLESALSLGYQSAFRTILDSNITTLFTALVLALIGSGAIKGFGVTLMIGLIVNLFTGVFITHFIYDIFVHRFKVKRLSIGGGIK